MPGEFIETLQPPGQEHMQNIDIHFLIHMDKDICLRKKRTQRSKGAGMKKPGDKS
jgi:hypothetical protein